MNYHLACVTHAVHPYREQLRAGLNYCRQMRERESVSDACGRPIVSASRINGIARPSKINEERPASDTIASAASRNAGMYCLQWNPDEQITGGQQDRPD